MTLAWANTITVSLPLQDMSTFDSRTLIVDAESLNTPIRP